MVYISDIATVKRTRKTVKDKTTMYAIVRNAKGELPEGMVIMRALSPSKDLYHRYMNIRMAGNWNRTTFENVYVPHFLKELVSNREALDRLNDIYKASKKGKNITLCCYCKDETICHRSIIAGLLLGAGCPIQCSPVYIKYWEMFQRLKKQTSQGN